MAEWRTGDTPDSTTTGSSCSSSRRETLPSRRERACHVPPPNDLDTETHVRSLIEFYVAEHNAKIPHSAFHGQPPDEMYFGTGSAVPDELASARAAASRARMEANRARRCTTCA
jgi:hypothetical protein